MHCKSMTISLIIDNNNWLFIFNLFVLLCRELKAHVELLSQDSLKKRFPWLNVDDIELGSLGNLNSGW